MYDIEQPFSSDFPTLHRENDSEQMVCFLHLMFETNRAGGNMKPFLDATHSVRLHVTYKTQIGNLTEAWRLKELDEKKTRTDRLDFARPRPDVCWYLTSLIPGVAIRVGACFQGFGWFGPGW